MMILIRIVLRTAMGKVTDVCGSQFVWMRAAQQFRQLAGWCASLMVMIWAAVPIPVWDDGRMD